ncbi:RNA-binding protein [Tropicimonas sp. IMCC34011]|uniref:RNA-binding protein n=1 Tax=Tropicimonas sp. IMCC34011 TaxID=2248759 RepID=UPI000E275AE2|nr:RNA-binding protein [Tropicimonas sp. IMCC34011]
MSRGGRDKDRDGIPERRCAATGNTLPISEMIRFVVGPEDEAVPDLAGKLPGRGIWITADMTALRLAVKKKAFARSAKAPVTAPADLPERVEALMAARVVDLLSMARKAGHAVCGYEKVKGWIETGRARVLIQASDGSERGKTKLRAGPEMDRSIGCLTARELGLSFGRDHAIHAALAAGGLARRIVEDASRLSGLRQDHGADAPERTNGSHERE